MTRPFLLSIIVLIQTAYSASFSDALDSTKSGSVEANVTDTSFVVDSLLAMTPYDTVKIKRLPLKIEEALELSRKNNREIKTAAAQLRIRHGEQVMLFSRFLPQVALGVNANGRGPTVPFVADSINQEWNLTVRQRVIEFGRTKDDLWRAKNDQRQDLYNYENKVVSVIQAVRTAYFNLLFTRTQVKREGVVLIRAQEKYQSMIDRLSHGMVKKASVLGERLNVLREKEVVLSLRQRQQADLEALKTLIGLDSIWVDFDLSSSPQFPGWNEEQCMALAVKNSTRIADAVAQAEVARTKLLEVGWEFAPSIDFKGTAGTANASAGAVVSANNPNSLHSWSLDLIGAHKFTNSSDLMSISADAGLTYTAALTMSLPVFAGLSRAGSVEVRSAAYQQARIAAIEATRQVEAGVRRAFFDLQSSRQQLDITIERIQIEKERFELNRILNEKGLISDYELDSFRDNYFRSQDEFLAKKRDVLRREEDLRALIRTFN